LYGDLAVEVRTSSPGALTMAVADGRLSLVVNLMAQDVTRWSDSASKILAARPPRRGTTATWEAVVAGPGVSAGSMSLARQIAPGDTVLVLLVTDASFQGVRSTLTMVDARALVAAMKRAAAASLRPAVPPAKRRPPAPR
jgi:hypothetical protein